MFIPIPPQKTCASSWLAAVSVLNSKPDREGFNVVIDTEDPLLVELPTDAKIIDLVNEFLKKHEAHPLQTIANTIFPQSTYERHGSPKFYEVYLEKIYPIVSHGNWGRYFERMIRCKAESGTINPLAEMVKKLHGMLNGEGRVFKNVFELGIYDPALDIKIYDPTKDASRNMNRQCLSFLSFKLNSNRELSLTAVYRNHYYIARLLGNMIGLGRLMKFITLETGATMGSLTIVSTHAEVDIGAWTRKEIQELLNACKGV
jgi:hypothetical protein